MKKRLLSLLLTGALCLSLSAPALAAGLENFQKTNTYTAGQFTDVPAGEWYAANVQAAYELGLMEGSSATTFNPSGNLTIAEALVLACRLHSTYVGDGATFAGSGGAWYQPYVDYAVETAILSPGTYSDYTATATRAQFASILAAALPAEALMAINSVTALPDVAATAPYAGAVLMLYNAGVLTGSDSAGSFKPDTTIQRSEVATIVTRMADPSLRKTFTLTPAETGEITQPADDGQITLDDLQGVWYSKEELEYSDTVTEKEWIIEGDQLTYSTTSNVESRRNVTRETGTITLITSDVVDMRGNHWPAALEFDYTSDMRINTTEVTHRSGTRTLYLSTIDPVTGTITQVDNSLGIKRETVFQKISSPIVENNVLLLLEGRSTTGAETLGYPSYPDYPDVPDFGAIFGIQETPSQLPDMDYYQHHCYPAYTKNTDGLNAHDLEDDYIAILEACGFQKTSGKNLLGDPITYYVNEAGLEVSIGYDLFEAETWYGETYWVGTASMLYISIQS